MPPNLLETLRDSLPHTPIYDRSSHNGIDLQPWNLLQAGVPFARIECQDTSEVQTALRIADRFQAPVSVAGGRRDPWARNTGEGVVIVDLRRMNNVSADADRVTIGGGTTVAQLLYQLPEGKVAVTAANGGVGMAGLAMGGGYGVLNNRFGLVSDTVKSADVVLANGSVVTASEQADAELLWALRGGGSGFGVVTSMTLQTFVVPLVLAATISIPLDQAEKALLHAQALIDSDPEPVNFIPLFMFGNSGQSRLFLAVVWTGKKSEGEDVLRFFTSLPGAEIVKEQWVPYRETLDPPELWPEGRFWYTQTCTLSRIDDSLAATLTEAARAIPASHNILFVQGAHGAPTRVAPEATAFPLRTPHFIAAAASSWMREEEAEAPRRRAWAEQTIERLSAHALPGGYISFLRPEETERVQQFYGTATERLLSVKRRLDPNCVFSASTGKF